MSVPLGQVHLTQSCFHWFTSPTTFLSQLKCTGSQQQDRSSGSGSSPPTHPRHQGCIAGRLQFLRAPAHRRLPTGKQGPSRQLYVIRCDQRATKCSKRALCQVSAHSLPSKPDHQFVNYSQRLYALTHSNT